MFIPKMNHSNIKAYFHIEQLDFNTKH